MWVKLVDADAPARTNSAALTFLTIITKPTSRALPRPTPPRNKPPSTPALVSGQNTRYAYYMAQSFTIRECCDDQWPQAIALIRSVFVGEGFGSLQRVEQNCRRELIEPAGTTLVAAHDDCVLGVVVLARTGGPLALLAKLGEAEFRLLAVRPDARGRGVGESLVRECVPRAAKPPHSAHTLVLQTQPTMFAAQRLYERLGFIRIPQRDVMLPPDAQGPAGPTTRERWAYELPLNK